MTLKCTECGQVFDDRLNECPNCACPASECERENNNDDNVHVVNENLGIIHGSYNEKPHHSPFSSDSVIFKDPRLLAQYPIGVLEKRHPFLGWLLGPWHLTCKDENSREQYDVINNIFYALNVMWKASLYPVIWTFFKTWIVIVAFIVVSVVVSVLLKNTDTDMVAVLCFFGIMYVFVCLLSLYCFFFYIVGIGKSLHRYWPQLHKVWRRLCKRFVNSMKN